MNHHKGTLFTIILGVLISACQPVDTDAIRIGLASAPVNLDPRLATDATSERINRLLYQRLVDFNSEQHPVAALAHWKRVNPRQYRLFLGKKGRRFHDGSSLDADDVVTTYRSILEPETGSPHRKTLSIIQRVEAIDSETVDFYLNRKDSLFPAYLTIGIVPSESVLDKRVLAHSPVGSGPFKLKNWPQPGKLELTRLADSQSFIFEQVGDPTMRILKLMRGEIDMLQNDLPPELLGYLSKQRRISVQRLPGSNFSYLGLNLNDKHISIPGIRRAIALAIDRQAIIEYIFSGAARPASSLLPPEHWAGGKGLKSISQDQSGARRLLVQLGYNEVNPLVLEYKTSSDPFRIRIATVIQQQLAEVGIRLKISSYDWGTFYGDIKAGRFQLFSLSWVGVKTPDIFRYVFHSASVPPDGANRGRFMDTAIDHLIDAAEREVDISRKTILYQQLQTRLLDTLPYVPLWYEDQFSVMRDNIHGYKLAADGNYDALIVTTKTAPSDKVI